MSSLQLPDPETESLLQQILKNDELGKYHFNTVESQQKVLRMQDLEQNKNEPTVSYTSTNTWPTEKTVHPPVSDEDWQSKFGARHQPDLSKKHFVRQNDPLSGAWLNPN